MNKILKMSLILFLVCAIVAGILGGVYVLTKDTIDAQTAAKSNAAYLIVMDTTGFTDSTADTSAYPTIDAIKVADGGEGWVVISTFSGAQGSITMAVGVSTDFKCTGISIIDSSETAGLGAIASEDSERGNAFRAQYVGVGDDVALAKQGGTIDALSGATITSTAVTNATATSIKACEDLFG